MDLQLQVTEKELEEFPEYQSDQIGQNTLQEHNIHNHNTYCIKEASIEAAHVSYEVTRNNSQR